MKEKATTFICDLCSRKIELKGDEVNFPYSDGWRYIYNFEWKHCGCPSKIQDKHFCCLKCLINYATDVIKREDKINGSR